MIDPGGLAQMEDGEAVRPNAFAVDRTHDDGSSKHKKVIMIAQSVISQAVATWICVGGGASAIGSWFGFTWAVQYPLRARFMAVCVAMLCVKDIHRILFILKRVIDLKEAFGVAGFMAVIYCSYAMLATGLDKADSWGGWWPTVSINACDFVGFGLFIIGWAVCTWAEIDRLRWKADEANRGRCYTGGLWAYSMHINYFGESVMLTGMTILTATWWMAWFPVCIVCSFIFGHIPALDEYLEDRYGQQFVDYAARTKKFCPFVY